MESSLLLIVGMMLLVAWNVLLTLLYLKNKRFAKNFYSDSAKHNAQTLLEMLQKRLQMLELDTKQLHEDKKKMTLQGKSHLQKIALVRYNPFHSTGGDQSFVLALLDAKGDGFVITSLHSRENTRVYAKRVLAKQEAESTRFSREEQDAIMQAMKQ